MLQDYLPPYAGNDKDDTFELLEQSQTGQRSNMSTMNDGMIKSTSTLPAKQLPLRSATQTVRSTFWVGCLAAAIVTALSIVASRIADYIPDTSFLGLNGQVSCDLMFQNGSAFQHAFTIDLRGSSELTFPQAKAIDIVWQLFLGMGGRLVMAIVAYKVFMDGLVRVMEDSAVSYQLYASLTFSTTSLFTTGRAIKGVMYMKGWRGKAFLVWFALSSIYVLGFPTLISATGGYLKPSTAGFKIDNATFLTPDSPALQSCYQVNYGALIGLQNGTIVQGPPVYLFGHKALIPVRGISELGLSSSDWNADPETLDYPVFASLVNSEMITPFRVTSKKLITSTEATINPPEPVYQYNNSVRLPEQDFGNGTVMRRNYTTNVTIAGQVYVFKNWYFDGDEAFLASYCYNNQTLPDLTSMAECLPETYYVWGLSSLLLYIVLSLQIAWVFGMYFVWLDANIYSALCRSGRRMRGDFRAAADLSEAMGEVLGNEHCAYSHDEMLSALDRESGLRYYATSSNNNDVAHIGISSLRHGKMPYNSTVFYGKRCKDE